MRKKNRTNKSYFKCIKGMEINMKLLDRQGNIAADDNGQDKLLDKLYNTSIGRVLTSMLIRPSVSKLCGRILDTKFSTIIVPKFCKANNVDLSLYEKQTFDSFNDFFTRKIKKELRPVDMDKKTLVSPCDSRLSMYKIDSDSEFVVKDTKYTVASLLRDSRLAKEYEGGYIGIFRLCVDDYHRYHYIDNGIKGRERIIHGVYHTVNPVANDVYPIYKENSREYCIHRTENFGDVIVMEVGALLVGKIVNNPDICKTVRGEEKGYFEYGGSTIILMFKKNTIIPDEDIMVNTANNCETKVRLGEKIGTCIS